MRVEVSAHIHVVFRPLRLKPNNNLTVDIKNLKYERHYFYSRDVSKS